MGKKKKKVVKASVKTAKAKEKKAKKTSKKAAKALKKSKKKATKGSKKQSKKATKQLKKAEKKATKAVKAATKIKLHKLCKCSGYKDKKGHGGSCKNWGWRMPWCYVSSKCKDRGLKVTAGKKWVPDCH